MTAVRMTVDGGRREATSTTSTIQSPGARLWAPGARLWAGRGRVGLWRHGRVAAVRLLRPGRRAVGGGAVAAPRSSAAGDARGAPSVSGVHGLAPRAGSPVGSWTGGGGAVTVRTAAVTGGAGVSALDTREAAVDPGVGRSEGHILDASCMPETPGGVAAAPYESGTPARYSRAAAGVGGVAAARSAAVASGAATVAAAAGSAADAVGVESGAAAADASERFPCNLCDALLWSKGGHTRHMLRAHGCHGAGPRYVCRFGPPQRGASYSSAPRVLAHARAQHVGWQPVCCPLCDQRFDKVARRWHVG